MEICVKYKKKYRNYIAVIGNAYYNPAISMDQYFFDFESETNTAIINPSWVQWQTWVVHELDKVDSEAWTVNQSEWQKWARVKYSRQVFKPSARKWKRAKIETWIEAAASMKTRLTLRNNMRQSRQGNPWVKWVKTREANLYVRGRS